MNKEHNYRVSVQWTGNKGTGTSGYREYERSHLINVENKVVIEASSDPAFRGDASKYNPEELFLASVSSCHMLWYLHFCSVNGIVVTGYEDNASGIMSEAANGSGRFTSITLHPVVTIQIAAHIEKAIALHKEANAFCFIAKSLNFEVAHDPVCKISS